MKRWLNSIYITPTSQWYCLIRFIHNNYKLVILIIFCSFLSFPIIRIGYYYYQYNQKILSFSELSDEFLKQETLLKSLTQNQQQNQQKDQLFTEWNQKLREQIYQHNLNVENIQWQFEQGKQVYLVLNQKSQSVFNFIYALDKIDSLYFNQVIFLKKDTNHSVQLQADMFFIN